MASALPVLDDDELQKIYVWVDSVPLSRPKRNISRDFSDGGEEPGTPRRWRAAERQTRRAWGCDDAAPSPPPNAARPPPFTALPPRPRPVLVAEVVHHYFPRLVELHNYSGANSLRQKLYNWGTLNRESPARSRAGCCCRQAAGAAGSKSSLAPPRSGPTALGPHTRSLAPPHSAATRDPAAPPAEKVFKRLGFEVKRGDVEAIVNCKPGVIESVLMQLQQMVRACE